MNLTVQIENAVRLRHRETMMMMMMIVCAQGDGAAEKWESALVASAGCLPLFLVLWSPRPFGLFLRALLSFWVWKYHV